MNISIRFTRKIDFSIPLDTNNCLVKMLHIFLHHIWMFCSHHHVPLSIIEYLKSVQQIKPACRFGEFKDQKILLKVALQQRINQGSQGIVCCQNSWQNIMWKPYRVSDILLLYLWDLCINYMYMMHLLVDNRWIILHINWNLIQCKCFDGRNYIFVLLSRWYGINEYVFATI